ncbi:peroxygenase-like [Carex rostrata]
MQVLFFDRNNDEIIYINKTYQGIRAIGVSVLVAISGSLFINGALSPLTRPPGTISSQCLPIYIENIGQGKHDSDTDAYDSEGSNVSKSEWKLLYNLAKDEDGFLQKDTKAVEQNGVPLYSYTQKAEQATASG